MIGKHVRDQGDVRLTFTPHPGVGDGLTFIHLMEYIRAAAALQLPLPAYGGEAMATISTPEKSALKILNIFVHCFKCRPGDVPQRHNFNTLWHELGLAAEDLKSGMEFAVQQGWIEVLSGGSWFKLTAAGFAKA